jgi:hypothetical protein
MRSAFPGIQVETLNDATKIGTASAETDSTQFERINRLFWNDVECDRKNWFLCQKSFDNDNGN